MTQCQMLLKQSRLIILNHDKLSCSCFIKFEHYISIKNNTKVRNTVALKAFIVLLKVIRLAKLKSFTLELGEFDSDEVEEVKQDE